MHGFVGEFKFLMPLLAISCRLATRICQCNLVSRTIKVGVYFIKKYPNPQPHPNKHKMKQNKTKQNKQQDDYCIYYHREREREDCILYHSYLLRRRIQQERGKLQQQHSFSAVVLPHFCFFCSLLPHNT